MRRSRSPISSIKAGIFDRDRDLRGEQGQSASVFFGEKADAFAFQIHDADDAILQHQGNGDFGADTGMGRDVARIDRGIGTRTIRAGWRRRR